MKAILLAAGVGSRLGTLTAETPKCLLPIAGRPLLDYWIESMSAAGVTEVLINLHHLAEKVEAYLERATPDVIFHRLYEPKLLGSAGTIRTARKFVEGEEEFFILYADNFSRANLRTLLDFHRAKSRPVMTMLAYRTQEPTRCGILEFDETQRVVSFEEKPARPRSNFANAGIHAAGPGLFEFLPEFAPADIGFHVLPKLVGHAFGYVTEEYILDIGTPENYARAQRDALSFALA